MNASTLRGLAALCLLFVLPRLGALTVTTSASIPITGFGFSSVSVPVIADWPFAPFDVSGAYLYAVEISGSASIVAKVINYNPRGFPPETLFPVMNGASISLDSRLRIGPQFGTDVPLTVVITAASQDVPNGMILPESSQTINFSRTNAFTSATITDPAILAHFLAGSAHPLRQDNMFRATTRYGEYYISGISDMELTFHYSVPEHGSLAVLMAVALLWLGLHRRSIRNRPGV